MKKKIKKKIYKKIIKCRLDAGGCACENCLFRGEQELGTACNLPNEIQDKFLHNDLEVTIKIKKKIKVKFVVFDE